MPAPNAPSLVLSLLLSAAAGCIYGPLIEEQRECGPTTSCPSGSRCVDGRCAASDAGTAPDPADAGGSDAETFDAGPAADSGRPAALELPVIVDSAFPDRSGFGPVAPTHVEDSACPTRAGEARGECHRFVWGASTDFTGAFWTDGAGFEDLEPRRIARGATVVRFFAWGRRGGETIDFGAGVPDQIFDGATFQRRIPLTTSPRAYEVRLQDLGDAEAVYAGFLWAANAMSNPAGVECFVDDIHWRQSPLITLPMIVDDHFTGRSVFSAAFDAQLHTEDDGCPTRPAEARGECHRFRWDAAAKYVGAHWTAGNQFNDLEALLIQAGATRLRFTAWGADGGETVQFGAGVSGPEFDGVEELQTFTLTSTPTRYSLPLFELPERPRVYGSFVWSANSVDNEGRPLEFYVDDIRWVR